MAVLADGRIASGDGDGVIRVWDTGSATTDITIENGPSKLDSLDQLPDGRLVSSSPTGLQIWDFAKPELEPLLVPDSGPTYGTAVLSDGRIVFGNASAIVQIWDPNDLSGPQVVYDRHANAGEFFNITSDVVELSNGLIASAASGQVHLWDPRDPAVTIASSDEGQQRGYFSITELSDGRFASESTNGSVYLWDIDQPQEALSGYPESGFYTGSDIVELGPDLVASRGQNVWVWAPSAPSIRLASFDRENATRMVLLPDGRLAIGYFDGEIHLWDPSVS